MELLLSRIAAQEGMPIDMTKYSMFFGFDVMGDVGECEGPAPILTRHTKTSVRILQGFSHARVRA